MNIDIIKEIKEIISNSEIRSTYFKKHSNTKYTLEEIINELIYVLKTGVSWRNLRGKINYKTLYWHFTKFIKNNIFLKLFEKMRNIFNSFNKIKINEFTYLLVDSTVIWNKFGIDRLGRNKYYKNKKSIKISLLTDVNGIPLSVFFINGNKHDNTTFTNHVDDMFLNFPNYKFEEFISLVKIIASNF